MLKASQKRTKRAPLLRGVDVEHAGQDLGLVGDEADGLAVEPAEADDDVLGPLRRDLEEVRLVDDLEDQLLHVVGRVGVGRDQGVEGRLVAVGGIVGGPRRDGRAVGQRQEVDHAADLGQGLEVVVEGAVGDAGLHGVDAVAAEVGVADVLVDHRLHHVRDR